MATSMINGSALTAVEACPAEVREILHAAACGEELTFEQGLVLATAEGSALEALVAVADQLRRETVGDLITYVVNRNINFTNVCFVGCSFCGFSRGPGAADAYSLSFDEVVRRALEAWERGATEVCVQGGLPRDLDGFFYRDLLRAIKHAIPEMHVHAFSPMEIDYGVTKTGMALRDYLGMMKDEGLGSIPGTAAEILDDRVRKELSPNKLPVGRWVEIITAAHELGIPTTSTMMYGHVEEPADWVRHLLLLRAITDTWKSPRIGCGTCSCCGRSKNAPADLRSSCRSDSSMRRRGSTVMVARGRERNGKSTCAYMPWRVCCSTERSGTCRCLG